MADESGFVDFNRKDARRIARTVRRSEGLPPSGGPPAPGGSWGWNPGVLRARVTVEIPPGTMPAPSGTGRVKLWGRFDGEWEEIDEEHPVLNDHAYSTAVAVDKAVKVAWIGLELWLVQADCP